MNKLSLIGKRDFALTTDALAFMQSSYAPFEQLVKLGGDNYILSGCVVTGSSVSSGWLVLKGKLLPFSGGTIQTNVRIVETTETITVDIGSREQTTYHAEFGTSADSSKNVAWANVKVFDSLANITNRTDSIELITSKIKHSNASVTIKCYSSSATIGKVYAKIGRSQSIWALNCKFTYAYSGETDPVFSFVGVYITGLSHMTQFFVDRNGTREKAEVVGVSPLRIKIYGTYPSGTHTFIINQTFVE